MQYKRGCINAIYRRALRQADVSSDLILMNRKTYWKLGPESRTHLGSWHRKLVSISDLIVAGIWKPEVDLALSADHEISGNLSGGPDVLSIPKDDLGDRTYRYLRLRLDLKYPEKARCLRTKWSSRRRREIAS
jgi:hypothetical protein